MIRNNHSAGGKPLRLATSSIVISVISFGLGIALALILGQHRPNDCPTVQTSQAPLVSLRSAEVPLSMHPASSSSSASYSLCHRRLKSRGELPQYAEALGLLGEAVEVGVRDGEFSDWILKNWRGKKLHVVDPWIAQDNVLYKDVSNVQQQEQDERYEMVKDRLTRAHAGRFEIHRKYSTDAAKEVADNSLDFVYVDARHDYAGVKEDLEAWWPKLRVGGLLAGHDFVPDGVHKEGAFGVQKAVFEFAALFQREIQTISDKNYDTGRKEPQKVDGGWTSFYFIK
ncbi:class I SAM-dependent methyltransferase [archaeon]|nr:MAG: class I SAM-dependent methyltransferase [archaeon]